MSRGADHKPEVWPQFFDLDEKADMKEPVIADIKGSFPKWIHGSLYRNGPGIYKMGEDVFNHLFDGFAVIHRWTVTGGKVTYRSSVLDSESYKKSVKINRLFDNSFGSNFPDPCKSIFSKFFSFFKTEPFTDNALVNLVEHGDKLFAMTEIPNIHQVDGDTMHSQKVYDISKKFAVHIGTAHPHFDPEGNMYYYATNLSDRNSVYNFIKFPPPKEGEAEPFSKGEVIVSLPSRWRVNHGYTHAFGMTENYIVHFEQPIAFNVLKLMGNNITGTQFENAITNFPNEGINIILANRKTGERLPITYSAPHGFVFHFVNAYEEGDQLVCDVCLWKHGNVLRELYLDTFMNQSETKKIFPAFFARFVLPLSLEGAKQGENLVTLPGSEAKAVLKPGKNKELDVTPDSIFENPESLPFELPRINYDYNAKKYRYAYGGSILNPEGKVYKFDTEGRKVNVWKSGDDLYPGEPVFIKDPKGTKEDDGVVLCPITSKTTEASSFLVCLDASTFTELGRALIPKEVKMNFTFHGGFYNRVY